MKRWRFRRCWAIPASILLAPFLMWLLIVLVAPTNWARHRLERAIESATGRSTRLQGLSVCLLGGIQLTGIEVGTPSGTEDPWLNIRNVALDVGPLSILHGSLNPTSIEVNGATLRVLRRADGQFEIADVLPTALKSPSGSAESNGESDCCALGRCLTGVHRMKVDIHQASVLLVDDVTGATADLRDVEGDATFEGRTQAVVSLRGSLEGGSVLISGHFDKTMREPTFNVDIETVDVPLTRSLAEIRYLLPVLTGRPDHVEGRLTGRVSLQGRGSQMAAVRKSLKGRGDLSVAPIRLEGCSILTAIRELSENTRNSQLADSIRTQFKIQDERVSTDQMVIQLGSLPIRLTGWTDFNGSLDYRMSLDSAAGRISDRARRFLRDIDPELDSMTSLELSGNLDQPILQLAGDTLPLGSGTDAERRREERLRQMGRRLLDKLVR